MNVAVCLFADSFVFCAIECYKVLFSVSQHRATAYTTAFLVALKSRDHRHCQHCKACTGQHLVAFNGSDHKHSLRP